jgi:hypothetical protein
MMRLRWLGVLAALTAATLILPGCGGGGGGVAPVVPTGSIVGRVVRADSVTVGLNGATVAVVTSGTAGVHTAQTPATTTDAQGNFTLARVPVGLQTLSVATPADPTYRGQVIPGIPVSQGVATPLTVTMLLLSQPAPTTINLAPAEGKVDLHGEIQFDGVATSGSGVPTATPTYVIIGGVGTVSPAGVFAAATAGNGELHAYSGDVSATATIEVTPPRPPEITTFVAQPTTYTASGGALTVTAAVNDGDGVSSVVAEIYAPGAATVRLTMARAEGTARDGTYRVDWPVPPNSNTPDPSGVQAQMTYSVRVVVTDSTSATANSSFTDLVVQGLKPPPPPPPS